MSALPAAPIALGPIESIGGPELLTGGAFGPDPLAGSAVELPGGQPEYGTAEYWRWRALEEIEGGMMQ